MKKFSNSKIIKTHYASNEKLRNLLYDAISETLKPVSNSIKNNLTLTGKEDLVEELVNIIENEKIDMTVKLLKEIKNEIKQKNINPVDTALNKIFEEENNKEDDEKKTKKEIEEEVDDEISEIEKQVQNDIKEKK